MSRIDSLLPLRSRALIALAGASLVLAGCAVDPVAHDSSTPTPAPASQTSTEVTKVAAAVAAGVAAGNVASARPGATPASVAQAAGAAAAAATGPKPFAEVIKDAKETLGLFRTWQKDEKVWIEIAPDQFGVPFQFTSNLSRGVGEQGVYGGMMLGDQIVEWKRIGNLVQLIAKNYALHRRRQCADRAGSQGRVHRQPARVDDRREPAAPGAPDRADRRERAAPDRHSRSASASRPASTCGATRSTRRTRASRRSGTRPTQSSFVVSAHYQNRARHASPVASALAAAANPFPPFTTLPDGRSLFLGYTYSFAKLPPPMTPRRADPRIGHFEVSVWDFSSDSKYSAKSPLRRSLATREEGSAGGSVRAEGADRLLRRPHRPRKVPGHGA